MDDWGTNFPDKRPLIPFSNDLVEKMFLNSSGIDCMYERGLIKKKKVWFNSVNVIKIMNCSHGNLFVFVEIMRQLY